MKAKVLYISESGKSASISVNQQLGPIVQSVTGFVGLPENHNITVGMELDIPASKVYVDVRITEEGKPFNFLRFE